MQRALVAAIVAAVLVIPLFTLPALAANLAVSADKDIYDPGDTVVINVVVEDNATSATVALAVYDPKGTLVYSDQLDIRLVNGTGTGTASFTLPSNAETGNWLIKAQYGSISAEDAFQVGGNGGSSGSGSGGSGGSGNVLVGAAFVVMAFVALAISLNKSKSPSRSRKR